MHQGAHPHGCGRHCRHVHREVVGVNGGEATLPSETKPMPEGVGQRRIRIFIVCGMAGYLRLLLSTCLPLPWTAAREQRGLQEYTRFPFRKLGRPHPCNFQLAAALDQGAPPSSSSHVPWYAEMSAISAYQAPDSLSLVHPACPGGRSARPSSWLGPHSSPHSSPKGPQRIGADRRGTGSAPS